MQKFVFLSIISVIFFTIIPPQALEEDLLMYYTKFSFDTLDFNVSGIYDLVIESNNPNISLQGFNFIPVILYNYLAIIPFKLFIFVNICLLVFLYGFIVSLYCNINSILKYAVIISPAMYICTSYTWRQSLSLFLALAIFHNSKTLKSICLLAIISIFVHPISVILLIISTIQYIYNKKFRIIFLSFALLFGSLTAYLINYLGAIKNNFDESINIFDIGINTISWFIYSIYFLLIYLKNSKSTNDKIAVFFLISFTATFIIVNQSPVAASRIYGAISIIASLAILQISTANLQKIILINLFSLILILSIVNLH